MSALMATLYGIKPSFVGVATIHCPDEQEGIDPDFACLEMSDDDFAITKQGKKKRNRTDKADGRYLDALQNGNLTTKEIAKSINRSPNSVQKHVRKMESRGLIYLVDTVPNGAYPALLWGLK